MKQEKTKKSVLSIFLSFMKILLYLLLVIIILLNATMLIRKYRHPNELPSFLGYKPLIVLSGSMNPVLDAGDLAIVRETPVHLIAEDEIIAFRFNKDADTTTIHRVIEVIDEDGDLSFITKGDANNAEDGEPVKAEDVEGKYAGHVASLGQIALFLQTPLGMMIFVIVPLALILLFDILSRRRRYKDKSNREAELEAELAALKAEKEKIEKMKNDGSE